MENKDKNISAYKGEIMTWCYMIGTTTASIGTASSNYYDWENLNSTTAAGSISIPWQHIHAQYPYSNIHEIRHEEIQEPPEKLKAEADAKEKAKNLLLEYLDDDNKQRFLANKPLEIVSNIFENIKYQIPISKIGRIKAWKENKIISELCILVKEGEPLPLEDVILTKLLYVINDEENVLRTANHSNVQENLLSGLIE